MRLLAGVCLERITHSQRCVMWNDVKAHQTHALHVHQHQHLGRGPSGLSPPCSGVGRCPPTRQVGEVQSAEQDESQRRHPQDLSRDHRGNGESQGKDVKRWTRLACY